MTGALQLACLCVAAWLGVYAAAVVIAYGMAASRLGMGPAAFFRAWRVRRVKVAETLGRRWWLAPTVAAVAAMLVAAEGKGARS